MSAMGNTNGPFVYTGFKPAFDYVKRTDVMHIIGIIGYKTRPATVKAVLYPQCRARSEGTLFSIDILSNGFKITIIMDSTNVSGGNIHLHGICRKSIHNINRNPNNSEVNYVGFSRIR